MDQPAQGQGCQGMSFTLSDQQRLLTTLQLSIAEERDRRRAVALAAHS